MPDPSLSHTWELLVQAAANSNAVRLAALISTGMAAGQTTFDRVGLSAAWARRWPRHTSPRPENRVSRAVPVLIGVTAVTDLSRGSMSVNNGAVLQLLADRVYMADALEMQHPNDTTLPVGEGTIAAAAAALGIEPETAAEGVGALECVADTTVINPPPPTEMVLTATADVIKGKRRP